MKMLRCVRIAAAVALLLFNVGIVPFASAAQTGGVPSLADQVQTLQTQVQTLQTQNQTLATTITNLQTTVVTLQSTNTGLQSALNAETAARIAAINALQAALNKEIDNRAGGDLLLSLQLNTLSNTEQFDVFQLTTTTNHLQSEVDALNNSPLGDVFAAHGGLFYPLNNNSPTDVVSVDLPAGLYLIHAVVPMSNIDGDYQNDVCALSTDPSAFGNDSSGSNARVYLPAYTGAQVPLVGTTNLATSTTVSVRCTGFRLLVDGATIEALPILSVH